MEKHEVRKSVDIIIPVYNAYEDLQICLESIKKYTDLNTHRVLIINDNSPDERIRPYLEAQRQCGFLIFHNKENRGFSNNINLGMAQSDINDVILLNSDTIVTRNWVEKILACAYSSPVIGTVTPLSNNATLCSVPVFCEENTLPDYLTVDDAADIIEKCSFCEYPQITVAHGFCMFIKRETIKKTGNFDAETFARGYGEENDFCNRAEQMGYIHVMCDNTYIYHSGTKSFISREKEKLIRDHEQILEKRYPIQMHNNAVYCRDNPNHHISENAGLFFKLKNGKKNILYILHSDFREGKNDNTGGTQFHVRDLKNGLCKKYNIFVAARNLDYLCVTAYIGDEEFAFEFYIGKPDAFIKDTNRKIRIVFENILEAFDIDLIHVHHIIGISFDIFSLATEKGIPVILTAHDFYYICPTIRLLKKNGEPCCEEKGSEECRKCLYETMGIYPDIAYLKEWRKRTDRIFQTCSKILFPSESAKAIYMAKYPNYEKKMQIVEHGVALVQHEKQKDGGKKEFCFEIDTVSDRESNIRIKGKIRSNFHDKASARFCMRICGRDTGEVHIPLTLTDTDFQNGMVSNFECVLPCDRKEQGEVTADIVLDSGGMLYVGDTPAQKIEIRSQKDTYALRVAFIGGLDLSKGSQVVYNIIRHGNRKIHWFTFGTVGDEVLMELRQSNYTAIGKYHPEDLTALLKIHQIDVIGILSIWPETYSYTLSEAIRDGIPVIATDLGAPGERLKRYGCGYTVLSGNAEDEFLRYAEFLMNDKETLDVLKEKTVKTAEVDLRNLPNMISEYEQIYDEIIEKKKNRPWMGNYDKKMLYQGMRRESLFRKDVVGGRNADYLRAQIEEYRILKSTLTYQLMMKVIHMRFPFKQKIMDIIYRLYKRK